MHNIQRLVVANYMTTYFIGNAYQSKNVPMCQIQSIRPANTKTFVFINNMADDFTYNKRSKTTGV